MESIEHGFGHIPVLPREVCEVLHIESGEILVDLTIGLAGHAKLLADQLGPSGTLIGLDVDPANLELAREHLKDAPCRIHLFHANFSEIGKVLQDLRIAKVNAMFADLGVASTHLDQGHRGFSFQTDGPLDMRMDPRLTTTAADIVNRLKDRELGDLIFFNSQESAARRIAQRICEVRREGRITTTGRLADIIASAVGVNPESRKSKIHPATLTFQALRMAVNEEIPRLNELLHIAPMLLQTGARFAIIAFHSTEDKVIKLDHRARKAEGVYQILTKKPLIADEEERRNNPRSRSAKLRAIRKIG